LKGNLKLTCFVNAGIQLALQIKGLRKILETYRFNSNSLCYVLQEICLNTQNPNGNGKVIQFLQTKEKNFDPKRQGDCAEVTEMLLYHVNDELYRKDNNINLRYNYRGLLRTSFQHECKHYYEELPQKTIFFRILFDNEINKSGINDIQTILNNDRQQECQDLVYCPECKKENKTIKYNYRGLRNDCVMLQVDRTDQLGKNTKLCSEKLNINEIIQVKNHDWGRNTDHEKKYELSGVVIYTGDMNEGHYRFLKRKSNNWTIFDDDKVSSMESQEAQELINKYGYLILYKVNRRPNFEDKGKYSKGKGKTTWTSDRKPTNYEEKSKNTSEKPNKTGTTDKISTVYSYYHGGNIKFIPKQEKTTYQSTENNNNKPMSNSKSKEKQ